MKLAALFLLAFSLGVRGQYAITWSTHDAGGGESSGGAYTLAGTAGQPDAGVHSAGPYTLVGGFWGAFSSAEPEAPPTLRIALAPNRVLLMWPNPSTGYQLQETASLSAPNWTDVPDVPGIVGTEKQVVLARQPGGRYFRLRKL
jgi:hypothetical protein